MVRTYFNFEWSASLQRWLGNLVEKSYRPDRYRWPTLTSFDAEIYRCGSSARVFIIRGKPSASAVPSVSGDNEVIDWPDDLPVVSNPFELEKLPDLLGNIYSYFNLRQQDYAMVIPDTECQNIKEDVQSWSTDVKHAVEYQIGYAMSRQLHYVRGFDRLGNFVLPPGYEFLARECERFFEDHPRYDRSVFMMTRFAPGDKMLVTLDMEVRRVLRAHDLEPVRADDKMYLSDRNIWNNVCVYMLSCSRGIAILEDRLHDEFNPNVALEYGFMRALNRPTLLLVDIGFRNLRADVIGTLHEKFDFVDIEATVQPAIERWLADFE